MKQKSAGSRENSTGRCAKKDQLSFPPFLIHGFGGHYQVLEAYFHLIYCFTSLIQLVLYLLNQMKNTSSLLFLLSHKRRWQNL